jgi:hypothetical protein
LIEFALANLGADPVVPRQDRLDHNTDQSFSIALFGIGDQLIDVELIAHGDGAAAVEIWAHQGAVLQHDPLEGRAARR